MIGRVLIVADDPVLVESLKQALSADYLIDLAGDGQTGIERLTELQPDLVVVDLPEPSTSGVETCRAIRRLSEVPVVVLTSAGNGLGRAWAYFAGADASLQKPVRLDALRARISALVRRSGGRLEGELYHDDDLIIDLRLRRVLRGGEVVSLTATEFRLLDQLVRHHGRVLSHRELLLAVWGEGYEDSIRCLYTYVHYLRRKLEHDPRHPRYIHSHGGQGYCFRPPETGESTAATEVAEGPNS